MPKALGLQMAQSQHQILNPEPKHVSMMEYNLFHTPLQSFVFIYAFVSANFVGLPKKIKNYCPRGSRIQCQSCGPDGKGETTASFSLLRRHPICLNVLPTTDIISHTEPRFTQPEGASVSYILLCTPRRPAFSA